MKYPFSFAVLTGATFTGAASTGAVSTGAVLTRAVFTGAALLTVPWCGSMPFGLPFGLIGDAFAQESASLAQVLVKHAHLAEPQAKEWSDAVISALRAELKSGNSVELAAFGRLYVQQRELKPRNGSRQPVDPGAPPRIRRYARFTSAPALKVELNDGGAPVPTLGSRPKATRP